MSAEVAAIFASPPLMEALGTTLERLGASHAVRRPRALRPWSLARLAGPFSGLLAGIVGFVT